MARRGVGLTLITLLSLGWNHAALAQSDVRHPPSGSAERRAVLDAIRPMAEREFGRPIVFVVEEIRVGARYAFVDVRPQRPGGQAIRMMLAGGRGDANAQAVLERRGRQWVILRYVAGASDVWYCEFRGRVPADILGEWC